MVARGSQAHLALREVVCANAEIIHSASGSYGRAGVRRRVSEGNGSYADAFHDDRRRRLEGVLP